MEINWWQVIATILGSSVISALLAGLWFNNRTEKIKTELQRNLYQYQTKFSLFHQREADAMAKLYEVLIDLGRIVDYVHHTFTDKGRKETTQKANAKFYEYIDTYEKNRIYFDDDLCREIEEIKNLVIEMLDRYRHSNNFSNGERFYTSRYWQTYYESF